MSTIINSVIKFMFPTPPINTKLCWTFLIWCCIVLGVELKCICMHMMYSKCMILPCLNQWVHDLYALRDAISWLRFDTTVVDKLRPVHAQQFIFWKNKHFFFYCQLIIFMWFSNFTLSTISDVKWDLRSLSVPY